MNISRVCVIGGGTMGNGIAHIFSFYGYEVVLIDKSKELLEQALSTIQKNLERQASKNLITKEQKNQALERITLSLNLNETSKAQLVIEAVNEALNLKKEIFGKLDQICPPETILATNTSSLSITEIASVTKRMDKVIGMHFMNPVPVMKLVELVRGLATSEETFKTIQELTLKLDKTPVEAKDYPGFISNRILMPMINEAIYALMENVGNRDGIDTTFKLGMNHPMGPLALADFIGLDVCLAIMEVLYTGFSDSKYRPCPLLRKMVEAGYRGRKSGRGFYEYK